MTCRMIMTLLHCNCSSMFICFEDSHPNLILSKPVQKRELNREREKKILTQIYQLPELSHKILQFEPESKTT